ncbi:MAG: LPS-assembly protein LptD [Pseudohongiellaceae bacterium]
MILSHRRKQIPVTFQALDPTVSFQIKLTIAMLLFLPGLLWGQNDADTAGAIDWVPWEQLTTQQQTQVPDGCCGLYIAPPLPERTEAPDTLVVEGGSGTFDNNTGIMTVTERLTALMGNILLSGDSGVYDSQQERFTLQGNVQIRQPGLLLVGSDATVERATENSTLSNASYVLHEQRIRGSAEIIVYTDTSGIVTIDNGAFSRCEPGDDSWVVSGKSIELDRESGRGTARNVTLRVNEFPVLYTPYISFPINDQRTSGFLAPIIGSTRDGGLDFSIPYYFNLAPSYDATLSPRILSDRGIQLGLEARHLGRRSSNQLNLAYLPNDDRYDAATAQNPDSDSPQLADRWLMSLDHAARLGDDWTSFIDYTGVSDEDYFQDLGNTGLAITSHSFLYRSARILYNGENWRFGTSALGFQVIDPSVADINQPYDRLPRISLDGNFYTDSNIEYGLNAEYVMFDRNINTTNISQAQIDGGALVTGQRLSLEPELAWQWSTPGSFVIPRAKYRYAGYKLEDQALNTTDSPSRGIFVGSLDSGLIFERETASGDNDLIQTLEPRLFYLYSEYEDQSDIPLFDSSAMTFSYNQMFREDRFSGQDRVGDTRQLTTALSTRFLDQSGREKASASIGQILYFDDRRVTINNLPGQAQRTATSALVSELSWQFSDNWRAYSYLEWNTSDNSLDVGNFQFRYQSDINHILNFGYRYRDVPNPIAATGIDRRINQSDISAVWPLTDTWGLIGRWNYDHANQRNLETIAGVEYGNCCWNVRVIAREWIDNNALFFGNAKDNRGVFLQFELTGFGSVLGGNVSNILNNGISGYREREYEQ